MQEARRSASSAIDLFIGIVTHPFSRYLNEVANPTYADRLMSSARGAGLGVQVIVNPRNAFDESERAITAVDVLRAAWFQARLEASWHHYLTGSRGVAQVARRIGILALRLREYLVPVRQKGRWVLRGSIMCRRLANIELSHLELLREAVDRNAEWILILEDDAQAADLNAVMRDLAAIIAHGRGSSSPQYVSLSASFDDARLGIGDLVEPIEVPAIAKVILSADRPVTNTVCAVLYRASFARELLRACNEMGMFPICAIDWKLNAVLMRMHARGKIGAGDCWLMEPGPFVQRSMQPA